MKKLFALALAALSTVSMFAAINSQLTIYLDTDSKEVEARIAVGDTYSPFNASASASYVPMYSNPSNIGMYVQYDGGNFMELNAPELVNVPLVIVTSREAAANQNYELFAEVGANHSVAVYVTDMRPDNGGDPVTFELNDNTDYSFSLANEAAFVEGENSVIADRFIINYDPSALKYDITLNGQYLATFSAPENVIIPEGLSAYTAKFQGEQGYLIVNQITGNYIPKNTGVILFNKQGGASSTQHEFSLVKYTGSDPMPTITNNDLKPSSAWVYPFEGVVYVLHDSEMWLYDGANMKPKKAFLHVGIGSGAPQRIRMVFSEEQGIESIAAEGKAVKFVENGRVFIKRGDKVYNLQGQLVK